MWGLLCRHWDVFRGTPVKTWMEAELVELFGVERRPSVATADAIYDQVAECLAQPAYRPRALFGRFGLQVLAYSPRLTPARSGRSSNAGASR